MEIVTLDTKKQLVALFGNKPQDCVCQECRKETNFEGEDLYYECAGCNRVVPYCFGQADRWFDYCNDCAIFLEDCEDYHKLLEKEVNFTEIA